MHFFGRLLFELLTFKMRQSYCKCITQYLEFIMRKKSLVGPFFLDHYMYLYNLYKISFLAAVYFMTAYQTSLRGGE